MPKVSGSKYEMEYISSKNMIFIRVWGFYTQEDAMAFINSYSDETKKFNPKQTSLIIDATELLTSKPEAKLMLIECMKLYMQLPYKNRIFIKSQSATANIMIKSTMKDGGMVHGKDALILDSISAAEDYIMGN
jgi:hypothetical protein